MKEEMIQPEVKVVTQSGVLFKPGSWLAKIQFINHLILFNNVLVTILSEKEGGKTSFGVLLQRHLDQQIESVSITIQPPYCKEQLIKDIATQLHLDQNHNTEIMSIVQQINERKSHVLLLVDDAQNLADDLINELLLAIKSQEACVFFHLCFLSDYSIAVSLNHFSTPLGNHLIHTIELENLNEDETRAYVLQRAMTAHLISKPLSDAQFKQFYQLTKGNLAKINHNLEEYICTCANPPRKDVFKPVKTAGIAGLVFLIGFLGFHLPRFFNFSSEPHSMVTAPIQNKNIQTMVMKLPEQPKPLESYIAAWQDLASRQLVDSSLPKTNILNDMGDKMPNETMAIVDKMVMVPKLLVKNKMVEEHKIQAKRALNLMRISPRKQMKLAKSSSKKSLYKSSDNLYTIQLTASHNKKHIEQFRRNNKLLAQHATVRHFTNSEGVWYVLTLGGYQSKIQAQHHVKQLPTSLVKLHPWIRSISSFEQPLLAKR